MEATFVLCEMMLSICLPCFNFLCVKILGILLSYVNQMMSSHRLDDFPYSVSPKELI